MAKSLKNRVTGWFRKMRWQKSTVEDIFGEIYSKQLWKNKTSVSGPGSEVEYSKQLLFFLPYIIKDLNIKSITDIGCGDFNLLKEVDLTGIDYTGIDIVPELIMMNREKYGKDHLRFEYKNIVKDDLPSADLVICRDVLVHLGIRQISEVLEKVKMSGAKYFLSTTFPSASNTDIVTGTWRPVSLTSAPFYLDEPLIMFNEFPFFHDKNVPARFIALWKLTT